MKLQSWKICLWRWKIKKFKWCLCFCRRIRKWILKNWRKSLIASIENICIFLGPKRRSRRNKDNLPNWKRNPSFCSFRNQISSDGKWKEIKNLEEKSVLNELKDKITWKITHINRKIITTYLETLRKISQNISTNPPEEKKHNRNKSKITQLMSRQLICRRYCININLPVIQDSPYYKQLHDLM